MISEKDFEDIVCKYPELIEEGLILKGRQVTLYGRRMDILFEDKFKRKLIVELKSGPIKDEHIGQILSYEGMILSADNPTIRTMLIGSRVPPNIQRSLDHHGIAWKELTFTALKDFLNKRKDSEFLPLFEEIKAETPISTYLKKANSRMDFFSDINDKYEHGRSPEEDLNYLRSLKTPKFAVISPTHISGRKKEAWGNFKNGGYIAMVSRIKKDLTNKSMDEILQIVMSIPRYNSTELTKRLKEYPAFLSLQKGDYVAVNNTNDGLFGVGIITGDYYFKLNGHNTGSVNPDDFYSHFYPVKWLVTTYHKRKDILNPGEKGWPPYGIISLVPEVPDYIKRILREERRKY